MDDNWCTYMHHGTATHQQRMVVLVRPCLHSIYIYTYMLQNNYTVLELFGLGSILISRLRANSCSGVPGGKAEL